MIIIEENFTDIRGQIITEGETQEKKFFLEGVFAEAETRNRNGRRYSLKEMIREAEKVNAAAQEGRHILGELDHPNTLEVKLKNVSHRITKMWMNGNKAHGKAEILQHHPNGQIAIGLMKDGVQLGVSTRGSGKVKADGLVENFNMITVDIVATPSARSAYPQTIQEQLEMYNRGELITDLAEAVIHDNKAQKYFQKELKAFISTFYK
jgi:hypothetical protein